MPSAETRADTLVIFGASGDLTARKLVPSLFNLRQKGRLPETFTIVGSARTAWDDDGFREHLRNEVAELTSIDTASDDWRTFEASVHYIAGDMTDADVYARLAERIGRSCVYYFATAPRFFAPGAERLAASGLLDESDGPRRVVIEKPFGVDRASAHALSAALHAVLRESQIFRIDHYLGKETVQNLMVLRFANAIFEPLWNRNYIDHVQITVAESVGAGHRAGYYDRSGVLRDMVQSHLLQLLTLVALEPPSRFNPTALRNEKVKVLDAIRPITGDDVARHTVRGQYRGYRDEGEVDRASDTATYAALRVYLDNWRWQGVPFFLRTGKALAKKETQISIQFRCPPLGLFDTGTDCRITSNVLTIEIQPEEGIHMRFETKVPDHGFTMVSKEMEFFFREAFEDVELPDAYERLLLDAINGDASLFTRDDEIDRAWAIVDAIQAEWDKGSVPLADYEPGSWGPDAAAALLRTNRVAWHLPKRSPA